ncbi:MAG: hypothetical protein KDG55_05210 [Rhodocyclaceae bacterium]|nr:hypothetical protein [Rhodocyclaceae bacterium]
MRTRLLLRIAMLALLLNLTGCPRQLVQPYDNRLLDDAETLYRETAAMIDRGIRVSPANDAARAAIAAPETHAGHASQFRPDYASAISTVDVMLLRALASQQSVSPVGERLQTRINSLLDEALPSACAELQADMAALAGPRLTIANLVDLKCLLIRWQAQHEDPTLTRQTLILKQSNWALRKSALFKAVLSIETAERAKSE